MAKKKTTDSSTTPGAGTSAPAARPRRTAPKVKAAPAGNATSTADERSSFVASTQGAPVTAPGAAGPTYDEIAEAAYHRYLKRGGGDGHDFDDWLEAEQELKAR
jgi:hypothetical protein